MVKILLVQFTDCSCFGNYMHFELVQGDLFESSEEGILLTIDGASKGMEGNLARRFARLNPDAWEEVEYEIRYPMPLGTAKLYEIPPDTGCKYKYCFIASTLNHLDVLSDQNKLKVQSSAFRQVLSLAQAHHVRSVSTAILVGGWRIELCTAFAQMVNTYTNAIQTSTSLPRVNVYIMDQNEHEKLIAFTKEYYPNAQVLERSVKII